MMEVKEEGWGWLGRLGGWKGEAKKKKEGAKGPAEIPGLVGGGEKERTRG